MARIIDRVVLPSYLREVISCGKEYVYLFFFFITISHIALVADSGDFSRSRTPVHAYIHSVVGKER